MIIKSIELSNFRNYEHLDITFDEGTNILYGDNAQGKTNILEAAYVSGTTKSHKGSRDKEMIRFDQTESHIKTLVEKNEKEYQIDIHLKKNKAKGIAINKVPIKKASELFGKVLVRYKELQEEAQDAAIMTRKERMVTLSEIAKNAEKEADMIKAIDTLNKMDGDYTSKVELSGSVKTNPFVDLSTEELRKLASRDG